ncbi:MAG TPA: right-handed parallel beta-helix repeat-containing protein, partial [Bdellovibrionales bacterium]|nr:right-handed parallel beta-helix repeat-containing protein [Bdellovibrionales bacterium]
KDARGQTFYIDSSKGSDENTGLAEESPWKTFANLKIREIKPGDTILLKRGEVWFDTLSIEAKGTEAQPVRIGTYGEGQTLPIISGSVSAVEIEWKKLTGNIWSAQVAASEGEEPLRAFQGDKSYRQEFLKERFRRLKAEGDWAWESTDGGTLFVRSTHSPASWREPLEFNVRRYGIDIRGGSHFSIEGVAVVRARDGLRVRGGHGVIKNLVAEENSVNGVVINGGWNRIENVRSLQNRVGFFIEGEDNQLDQIVARENIEDGIQFGPESGGGNSVNGAKISGNGENCIDVRNGDQQINGGELASDAETSSGCILAHKNPLAVRIQSAKLSSLKSGPAVYVSDGSRVSVDRCELKSDESSVILLAETAGNGSVIVDSKIGPGGSKSKSLIEVRHGRGHRISGNTFMASDGVVATKVNGSAAIMTDD